MIFSGFKNDAWQDMRFSEFLKTNWDAQDFCHLLALKARNKVLAEMALATGEVSKMPILWDKDDWKFLYQFPPELWNSALKWRYNDGLRDIMRTQQHEEHVPEDWNYTDHIIFDKPGEPNKKLKFGKENGPKNIYIGLTNLVHKLTDPHKGPKSSDETQPYWAGHGPGIHEINPNETDPNHPKHPSKYKHGLYDYDLSGLAEVSPDLIEEMPDWEIHELLPEKYKAMDISNPQVQKAIKKKRQAMLDNLKHTMAGYSVLQQDRATEHMANWIKANALPEKLQGEHPNEIEDPYDANENGPIKRQVTHQPISKFLDSKQLKGSAIAGNTVPAVEKTLHWTEYNSKTGTEKPVTKTVHLPVLNPSKTIPAFKLTDQERLALAKKRGYDLYPGETYDQAVKRLGSAFVTNTKLQGLQGLLDNWDIFSPERKEWMKKHVKDLMHVAQTEKAGEEINPETGMPIGDPHADPRNRSSFYAPGFYPNYGTPEIPKFRLPQDKVNEFVNKYKGRIYAELVGTETKGKVGEQENSMLSRILRSMKKSEKYPPQVIEALESSIASGDLTTFLTYMLLAWLDNPYTGIKDDEVGLLRNVPEGQYDEKANRRARQQLVFTFLSSIAQYGNADVLTRRQRERSGVATKTSLDKPIGDTGTSGAGQVEAGQGAKEQKVDTSAKRAYLHSGTQTTVRASHKMHKAFSNVGTFMASRRNYVLSKLKKVPGVASELDQAEERITAAINTSVTLFQDYENSHPNASEEEILKYVHDNLQNKLQERHPQLFGGMKSGDKEWENLLAKTKGLSKVGVGGLVANKMDAEVEATYKKFLDDFITKGEGHVPIYDANTNEFKEGPHYSMKSFNLNPEMVIKFISAIVPEQFAGVRARLIKEEGLRLFKEIIVAHPDSELEDEAEIEKMWNKAYAAWMGGQQGGQTQQTPAQPQAQPAPMPKPVAQPQTQAAKPVGELLDAAGKINTPQEMIQIGQALLSKKNELAAMPGSAAKVQAAIKAMRMRRLAIVSSPPTQEEHMLLSKLGAMVGELHAAQG